MSELPLPFEKSPLEAWIARKIGCAPADFDRQKLEVYQLARLQETIRHVKLHSRFYREKLAGLTASGQDWVSQGLVSQGLVSLDDFSRYPLTTAGDIQAHPGAFLCAPQSEIRRLVTLSTSGTSDEPKRLAFTGADLELTIDFFQAGMSTFTRPGDRVLILLPGERPDSVGDLLFKGLERLGAEPFRYGPVLDAEDALSALHELQITVLVGAPVQVLSLARQRPAAQKTISVRDVLLTTDHVPRAILEALENAWGCRVFNHYGMTEMGLGGGVDCQAHMGYHLREADLYFEIVDPHSGIACPEGEVGEIVFTTLTRVGMPLLRYRTGDLGRFLPGECACGARLKRLERVTTRIAGQLLLQEGATLSMSDLDEAIFPVEDVLDFSAWLEGDGNPRRLILTVWASSLKQTLARRIEEAVKEIPAIRAMVKGRGFEILVRLQDKPLVKPHPMAKRSLRYRRSGDL